MTDVIQKVSKNQNDSIFYRLSQFSTFRFRRIKKGPGPITVVLVGLGACLILAGNAWTTKEELKTAPFRKDYLQISRDLAMNYRTAGDAELVEYLHNDPDSVRKAMKILEENNLNLFRK